MSTGEPSRDLDRLGHDQVPLRVRAELEDLRAYDGEALLSIEGLRTRVVLPHAQPHRARAAGPRRVFGRTHQRSGEAATVPGRIDIETPQLDRLGADAAISGGPIAQLREGGQSTISFG